MFNFNHLYYFYIAVKSNGVSTAAQHLRISQPSLSNQLKVLEKTLNFKLFKKIGRKNQLTQKGSIIYGFCRQMFEISENMSELILQDIPSATRKLHIGVSDEVDRPFVAEVISLFLKQHELESRPKISVSTRPHHELIENLQFRELDAVITQVAMIEPELENLAHADIPVALTCSGKYQLRPDIHTLKAQQIVKELTQYTSAQWLMPSSRFKLRTEIDQFFERNELKGRITLESDVIAPLVQAVIDEIGLAFLPLIYVTKEIKEKKIRTIGPEKGYWKYRIQLSCHSQNKNDTLIQALTHSFETVCTGAIMR